MVNQTEPIRVFLCGDVMTGRGVDQALPHPGGTMIVPWYQKVWLRQDSAIALPWWYLPAGDQVWFRWAERDFGQGLVHIDERITIWVVGSSGTSIARAGWADPTGSVEGR